MTVAIILNQERTPWGKHQPLNKHPGIFGSLYANLTIRLKIDLCEINFIENIVGKREAWANQCLEIQMTMRCGILPEV